MPTGDIAILFLAHAGVSQGLLWETWRRSNSNYASKIKFYVHTGGKTVHGDLFVDMYDTGCTQPTSWGNRSLVLAYQEGIRYILDHNKQVKVIHFVSGADIPLQSTAHVYNKERKTRFRRIVESNVILPPRSIEGPIRPRDLRIHQQWHSITRKDAQVVADYDFNNFEPWDKFFRKLGSRLKAGTINVPDEYYVGTLIKAKGNWKNVVYGDEVYTDAEWPDREDATGPILFKSMNGTDNESKQSLREIISDSDEAVLKHALWFRKVGPKVNFMDPPIVLPWLKKMKARLEKKK